MGGKIVLGRRGTMDEALDRLRGRLLELGAIKLSWSLDRRPSDDHCVWECTAQAANEMGAPVELPSDVAGLLEAAIHGEALGEPREGVWLMDLQTGHITGPQPRPGDGASAPGVAERLP